MMTENYPTIISLEMYGKKVHFEFPYSGANASEVFNAFCAIMVAQGFPSELVDDTIIEASLDIKKYKNEAD